MAVYKKVPFERNGVRQGILCDDPQQGPSALIAAYNILSIRHSSVYGKEGMMEEDTIKDLIRGTLKTAHDMLGRSVSRSWKRKASRAIDGLHARTDVRPLPSGALSFEVNDLYLLFCHLGIHLMHGWVADPESSVYESVKYLSPAKLAQHCASLEGLEEKRDDLVVVQGLLNDSEARQLTAYGFFSLLENIDEGEFAVVFCHSRFNVVHKHDGELFVLETDEEVRGRFPQVVWRLFEEVVEEDGIYLTEKFTPVKGQPNIAKAREWIQEKLGNKKNSTGIVGTSSDVGPPTTHASDETSGNAEPRPVPKAQQRKCRERRKR
ncbi:unnamed protein product [Urochloa humidicola]